jgi:hypothetical protein
VEIAGEDFPSDERHTTPSLQTMMSFLLPPVLDRKNALQNVALKLGVRVVKCPKADSAAITFREEEVNSETLSTREKRDGASD